jgi:hypothetical protein
MAGALACFSVSLVLGADRLARRAMTSPPQSTFARAEQDFSPVDFTCTTSSADDPTVRTCKFDYAAGTSPGASVVLFGDSHAAQWFPAADSIARLRHWTLVTVLKAACSPASIRIYSDRTGRDNTACTAWRDSALALIGALRPSLVLMSTAVHYLTLDGKQIRPVTRDEWDDGVRATLQRLAAVGARTVFFRDPPTPGFMVPECLSRAARPRAMSAPPQFPGCTSDRASTLDTVVFHAVIANATPSLSIADLSDQFCDAARCWPTRAGDVIFRDDNHITASYIAHLTSVVAQRLPPAESIPAAHGAGYATR